MSARKKTSPTARVTTSKKTGRRPAARKGGAGSTTRRRWSMAAVTAAVVAALVALAVANHSSSPGSGSSAASVSPTSGGGAVGSQVSQFTLRSISGQEVSAPVPGHPGVIFFTVSSCSSCIPSAQALSALKARFGSRIGAVMVDIEASDSPGNLEAWGNAVGHPSFPLAIDTSGRLAGAYQIQYLGTTIIYNAQGKIVDRLDEPRAGELESGLHRAGLT